jgi:acetyl-CoA C-acetyltransferase
LDSGCPILIGAAQFSDRDATLDSSLNPIEMLTRIASESADSSGGGRALLESVDTIAIASILGWKAKNPPRLLAQAIGAKPRDEISSHIGGETALALTNLVAEKIMAGDCELGFVGGCNNLRTFTLARKAGTRLDWPIGDSGLPELVGKDSPGNSEAEKAVGLAMPIHIYPIFENALRAARGQSLAEHRSAMGDLFHPFTTLAAANPHAWFPTERSARELAEVSADNRMICFPYPKYLNAVMTTDQAAGALFASQAMARKLGIPEENWIYWRGGAVEVEDPWFLSERPSYFESPAMRSCHERALANSGLDLDEIELIDFYSCFPSAVSMACDMLGLSQDDPRGFTLTGGLPYAGGPGNSYGFHSLATAFDKLREKAGEHALLTGNGWYLTKHSATVLSRQPGPPSTRSNAESVESKARSKWSTDPVQLEPEANGAAVVESYTIIHGPDGAPERGIIIGRLKESNRRFLANTPTDPQLLADLEKAELIGTQGHVRFENGLNAYRPA